jgi:oligogalacturonide transporter
MIPLCIRFGPAPSYRMVVVLFGLASLLRHALLRGLSDVYALLLLISAVAGLGRGGINYVPWNTYTYIADVDEVITGQRREGIFAGIMTLTRKASQAGAVMLVGIVMQMSGFVSGQKVQPAEVSHTILMILSVGTFWCCSAASSSPCASNSICKPTARCAETAKMRESGRAMPETATPQARATVEMLAGMPYDSVGQ